MVMRGEVRLIVSRPALGEGVKRRSILRISGEVQPYDGADAGIGLRVRVQGLHEPMPETTGLVVMNRPAAAWTILDQEYMGT